VDVDALAALMFAAYAGTLDAERSDTLEGAVQEVRTTFEGGYGAFLPAASFVVEVGDRLVSARPRGRSSGPQGGRCYDRANVEGEASVHGQAP
jgi:hypothetical protein